MEPEHFKVHTDAANKINSAKDDGRKVFACGTTTVKALESACDGNGKILDVKGKSDLFIYPGYVFKSGIHALLTNFHLPESTLIMLVSAFAGREIIMNAYKKAIENDYRFYSFGDAMLILR
jgi:S-adenosylmethionine:tRNA ribosyltransferase-isomerase